MCEPNQSEAEKFENDIRLKVISHVRSSLRDPSSYEAINTSELRKNEGTGTYYMVHQYRAKNSFGGYNVENQVFEIDSKGEIISSELAK